MQSLSHISFRLTFSVAPGFVGYFQHMSVLLYSHNIYLKWVVSSIFYSGDHRLRNLPYLGFYNQKQPTRSSLPNFLFLYTGNNVEVGESLFQVMDDLELVDDEDEWNYNPTDSESDLTDWWALSVCTEAWLPQHLWLCWKGVDFPFFFSKKKFSGEYSASFHHWT